MLVRSGLLNEYTVVGLFCFRNEFALMTMTRELELVMGVEEVKQKRV